MRRLKLILPTGAQIVMLVFIALPFVAQPVIKYFEPSDGDLMAAGIQTLIAVLCTIIYGGYRVGHFHPLVNKKYGQWLAMTPWSYGKPLPLGPVRIVWEDLIVLAVLSLAVFAGLWNWLNIADFGLAPNDTHTPAVNIVLYAFGIVSASFILTYLLFLTSAIRNESDITSAIAFLLPLTVYPHLNLWIGACVCVLICYLISLGHRKTLRSFPWDSPVWTSTPRDLMLHEMNQQGIIGWPYRQIGPPHTTRRKIEFLKMIRLSALIGWWMLAIPHGFILFLSKSSGHEDVMANLTESMNSPDTGAAPAFRFFWMGFVLLVAGARLFAYLRDTMPPISLLGRIKTGRWLIPEYDKVLAVPLLMVVYGWFCPRLCVAVGMPLIIVPAVSITGLMMMQILLGPTQESWRHTGLYRAVAWGPPSKASKKREDIQLNHTSFKLSRLNP